MYFFWKQSPLLINYLIDELKQNVKEKQPKKRVHLIMLVEKISVQCIIYLHLHLVIWQTLLSKATYNWGVHKAIHLEEAIRQRKCS